MSSRSRRRLGHHQAVLDSDFWNDLGKQFRSIKNCKQVCVNWADVPGTELETWEFGAVGTVLLSARLEFKALAQRAGAKIDPESDDTYAAWLSRLKREGRKELVLIGATYPSGDMTRGQIQNVCRVSADYCKVLESKALRTEQQEKRGQLPKDVSRHQVVDEKTDDRTAGEAQKPGHRKVKREPHPDPERLFGTKTKVPFDVAADALGVTVRRVRELVSEEHLKRIGDGHAAGISTDSLRARL